jgi:hypothetical protein
VNGLEKDIIISTSPDIPECDCSEWISEEGSSFSTTIPLNHSDDYELWMGLSVEADAHYGVTRRIFEQTLNDKVGARNLEVIDSFLKLSPLDVLVCF